MEDKKDNPVNEEVQKNLDRMRQIRAGIRITKITCTRSVKGRNGDSFVAWSAAWQSVQDDQGGPGADVMATQEDDRVYADQGLSIKDARAARRMLAMEVDLAALESAAINGGISSSYYQDSVMAVRKGYTQAISNELGITEDTENHDNTGQDD